MMINRCLILLRPKEPFFEWLRSLPELFDISLEEYVDDSTVFLLPGYEVNLEKTEIVEQFYDLMFEQALRDWWTDEKNWPQARDLAMFNEWFLCEFHSLVLDLVDAPLEHDE